MQDHKFYGLERKTFKSILLFYLSHISKSEEFIKETYKKKLSKDLYIVILQDHKL